MFCLEYKTVDELYSDKIKKEWRKDNNFAPYTLLLSIILQKVHQNEKENNMQLSILKNKLTS
jgi:hypothetical protein